MKRFLIFSAFFLAMQGIVAQSFSDYFEDKTLRIDYTFSGNHDLQHIEVSELKKSDGWYGRRHNLDSLPLRGNGQIYMKHKGKVVYTTSFSSLFQEWLTTEESTKATKSFENTFLLPFPKDEMDVTINLTNTHNKVVSELTYHINPKDILIRQMKPNKEQKTRYIHKGGDPKECIDVVIVAEGYTERELETFFKDAEIASESLFAHAPFSANKSKFNILAVGAVSKDSGVSIPRLGQWKNTALSSHFSTFYSDRYLTTLHIKDLHDVLACLPYEHIIILANTDEYGGGGIYNSYTLTTAHHEQFRPVVVHEFGHSFGGLADEYFYDDQYETQYPSDTEPWEPNLTTLVDFDSKWKDMLPKKTKIPTPIPPYDTEENLMKKIGVYEGGGYQSKGVYRPFYTCRMKVNEVSRFCDVCQRAMQRLIDFYTK